MNKIIQMFWIVIVFIGLSCNDELPVDTVIKKSSLTPTDEIYYAKSSIINEHLFKLSVKNLNKHEIGRYNAVEAPWIPISGNREILKGELDKYSVETGHEDQDEYDWNLLIIPDPICHSQFDDEKIECEVTPSDLFHESPWFPKKGTGKPSLLLGKHLCLYGPWVFDKGNDYQQEIHPIDAIWWQEREESNNDVVLMLVQDAAKGRYRNFYDYDFNAILGSVGWVKWVNYPQEEEILIPFEYNQMGSEYLKIDIEELYAINVTTALKLEFVDSDNGSNHKLKIQENGLIAYTLSTIVEVNEPAGKSLNLGVQFKEVSIDANSKIHGFVSIKAAIGHPTTKDEGVLVLKFHFSKGLNSDLPKKE
jgi:hypothetical protein